MLPSPPKEVREDLARASGYLRRDDVGRALRCMVAALRHCGDLKLAPAARAELNAQIRDFLRELVRHPALLPLLATQPGLEGRSISYKPGQEDTLCTVLDGLAKIIHQEAQGTLLQEAEARLERKKTLIESGLRFLRSRQVAKGRAFLRRVAEEFSEEEGIHLQVAQLLVATGEHAEAAALFEEAMRRQPREAGAYTGALAAWMEAQEYAKAEEVCLAVLRIFGGHPATFGKMAALYLAWHKPEKAMEAAQRALHDDPAQADALAVLAALNAPQEESGA